MKEYKGIDISKHNKVISFDAAARNVDFMILRAGGNFGGFYKDSKFEAYYNGTRMYNVPCGCYYDAGKEFIGAEKGKAYADHFLQLMSGKQFEYPVYFDVEEGSVLRLGANAVSNIITAFCDEMEKAGYFVGLYMSASPLTTYVTQAVRERYAIWVAHYGVSKPSYSGQYGMWQYSSTGRVDGINGNVDMDECYVDYPALIKANGKNGFEKPKPQVTEPKPESVVKPEEPKLKTIDVEVTVDGVKYAGTLTEKK